MITVLSAILFVIYLVFIGIILLIYLVLGSSTFIVKIAHSFEKRAEEISEAILIGLSIRDDNKYVEKITKNVKVPEDLIDLIPDKYR